ncbi:serine-rich coiled-coil domain-containing protein 2 isoform X2 [Ornithorhynchus anatinus]|uniref:serine-rich coiled-coil domain-containing protein 2 isoform X2 n=1 Tax=Ornithorhynchus anatinus TaxID=9258 RepID=UPI0010A90A24|nr:serine-rich coiled-coil domain-containing protein 2 isoform X2 [Ornithorhynchus anatinus]
MEEKIQLKASLASRLPKYGTKSVGGTLQSMPNGTAVNLSGDYRSSGGKNCIRQNGSVHMSSYPFNWRKSNKYQLSDQSAEEPNPVQHPYDKVIDEEKHLQSPGAFGKDGHKVCVKSTTLIASKLTKPSNMFVSSSEELTQKSLPGLPSSGKFTKGTLLGRTSYSGLAAPKSHLNGFYGNRPTISLQRPRANSYAARGSSGESLAQSTDNGKSFPGEKMVRSQSFSHSIPNSLLPPASITRSHSFNRAVDLTRPYPNQQLSIRPPPRPTLLSRNSRQSEVLNGNEHLRYGFNRPFAALPGSGLKKPTLTNASGGSSSLGFRMGRPSLLKPNRSQFIGKSIVDGNKNSAANICPEEDSKILTDNRTTEKENDSIENGSQRKEGSHIVDDGLEKHESKVRYLSDDVDEISISSLSSSDKNDMSEDFSDDFIDIEDPTKTQLTPEEDSIKEEKDGIAPVKSCDTNKENEKTDEWTDISMSVEDRSQSTKHTTGNNLISPDTDYRASSSFELSPSDSSDGTYMWDEEGLEPIGSVHPCGSYESSEMNSIDILNNLDSCDLEDDDLMLDVDLPEDTPLDNVDCDNMNRFDRSDRNGRQQQEGFWKRTPQRWRGQEHYHLGHTEHFHHGETDNRSPYLESPVGHFENYGKTNLYQASRPVMGLPENTVMLDEMTLRHMVQDCTAVKTQLLKLKRLLHQNDENDSLQEMQLSLPPSPEVEDVDPVYKTEDLLNEIKQLKEEVKKKDETIKQLEHQLTVGCNCQKESPKSKGDKCILLDKYTQTSWRRSSPQVLQPSSSLPSSTGHVRGKLTKPPLIEAHSERPSHSSCQDADRPHEKVTAASQRKGDYGLDELPLLFNTQLNLEDEAEKAPSGEKQGVTESVTESTQAGSHRARDLQSSLLSVQTLTPANSRKEGQINLAVKTPPSPTDHKLQEKTSQLLKPSIQDVASSQKSSLACKESESTSTCIPLQRTPTQTSLMSKPNLKTSKLRPPTASLIKHTPTGNPKLSSSAERQNIQPKTHIPRPLAQRKENLQNPSSNLHSGDSLMSNRYSRLPKPKMH